MRHFLVIFILCCYSFKDLIGTFPQNSDKLLLVKIDDDSLLSFPFFKKAADKLDCQTLKKSLLT